MNHATVIYDITTESTPGGAMVVLYSLALPLFFLFFGINAFRKSSRKVGTLLIAAGILLFGIGVGSLFVAPAPSYRELIEKGEYTETRGTISNFIKSTLIAGNPVATFEVAGKVFEHGRGSVNFALDEHSTKSPLRNGMEVMIWDHEGKILKIIEQTSPSRPQAGQEVPANPAEPGD
ncbi:hypothetical protein OVA24_06125 [Luteolibacter sp. SL250]|uniref:hypothetical protein n=1 Tax=Luteolibacter sp. SL250 TaxID=2995170 RepID=UPI002270AE0D|nr:hypothetical protein [Luteolibacter sp. SL250]WAC20957.1 hypothetical protein OVA24_06125 [Luteolibacter sp. SL250]